MAESVIKPKESKKLIARKILEMDSDKRVLKKELL